MRAYEQILGVAPAALSLVVPSVQPNPGFSDIGSGPILPLVPPNPILVVPSVSLTSVQSNIMSRCSHGRCAVLGDVTAATASEGGPVSYSDVGGISG